MYRHTQGEIPIPETMPDRLQQPVRGLLVHKRKQRRGYEQVRRRPARSRLMVVGYDFSGQDGSKWRWVNAVARKPSEAVVFGYMRSETLNFELTGVIAAHQIAYQRFAASFRRTATKN